MLTLKFICFQLEDSVTLIEIPPNTLRQRLVRNCIYDRLCETPNCKVCPYGRDGDCMCSGIVYLITCETCGDEYIGETGRPLCVRIKEHLDGKANKKSNTPLGAHRTQKHNGVDFEINVTILAQEPKISARRVLESFWIKSKNPKMNSKDECLHITHDLIRYIRLFFWSVGRHIAHLCKTLSGWSPTITRGNPAYETVSASINRLLLRDWNLGLNNFCWGM